MMQRVNQSVGSTLTKYPARVGRRSDEEYEIFREALYDGFRTIVNESPALRRVDQAVAANLVLKEIPAIIDKKMELVKQLESCGYDCYIDLDS